jgi:hypothetical protein
MDEPILPLNMYCYLLEWLLDHHPMVIAEFMNHMYPRREQNE